MRKLGSLLVILLLLTAYGRCVADQLGTLHMTGASCCQTSCSTDDHSGDEDGGHQDDPEQPCQLCSILSGGSMLLEDGLVLPAPTLVELIPLCAARFSLDAFPPEIPWDLTRSDHPAPPDEQLTRLRRIVAKTTPVRGPSIA